MGSGVRGKGIGERGTGNPRKTPSKFMVKTGGNFPGEKNFFICFQTRLGVHGETLVTPWTPKVCLWLGDYTHWQVQGLNSCF